VPYQQSPFVDELPSDDTIIWRFMSLSKFLSLITQSALFFCQHARLKREDPYEGTLSRPNLELLQKMSSDPEFAKTRWVCKLTLAQSY
jgi:hypothetical protein